MKRSLSFFYSLIILWVLPAAGEDGLLGTWEAVEEGVVEVTSVEEDGTLHRQTLEGETSLRATFLANLTLRCASTTSPCRKCSSAVEPTKPI